MKTLILMRHAKSDWSAPASSDLTRPLNNRGRKAAPLMGEFLRENALAPDVALISNAARTQETWEHLSPMLETSPQIEISPALYHASPSTILEVIRETPKTTDRVLVLGHNPGMHELACHLVKDETSSAARELLFDHFPTAAVAVFAFDMEDWRHIAYNSGNTLHYQTPKALAKKSH